MSHAAGKKYSDAMAVLKGQSVFKKLPVKPAVTDFGNTSATNLMLMITIICHWWI
jgi:hypothetical protein